MGAWTILMCAAFLLLGDSFKQAKVRRAHLARAMSYSIVGWTVTLVWLTPVVLIADSDQNIGVPTVVSGGLVCFVAPALIVWLLWFMAFWWSFTQTYLKLRHAAAAVLVLLLTSGLATAVLLVLLLTPRHP